jgi:hypothetical protein
MPLLLGVHLPNLRVDEVLSRFRGKPPESQEGERNDAQHQSKRQDPRQHDVRLLSRSGGRDVRADRRA